MKIKVRSGIFETNSSSMHSIAIIKKPTEKAKRADSYFYSDVFNGRINFYENDVTFGRYPFKLLNTPYHKLAYVLVNKVSGAYRTEEEMNEVLQKYIDMINDHFEREGKNIVATEIKFPTDFDTVWVDEDGNTYDCYDTDEVETKENEDGSTTYVSKHNGQVVERELVEKTFYGEIDHQSWDLYKNFIFNHQISDEEFIFNPKYIVIIDGDEYCIYEDMVESGMINLDNIEEHFTDGY